MEKRLTRRRVAALVAVSVVAALAVTASPAAAGGAHENGSALGCNWDVNGELFNSVSLMTTTSTARGRTELVRRGIADDTEIKGGKTKINGPVSFEIPVWIHIITSGGVGDLSDATVAAQIATLNDTFNGGAIGGAASGFTFRLAGTTRTESQEWFVLDTLAEEFAMKSSLQRGDATTLNMYFLDGLSGGFLGFAYSPSIVHEKRFLVLDGVVNDYRTVPGGELARFNLGYTAVHEAGHWLGLAHTFEKGCIGHGDFVDDTPAMSEPTSGCPEGKDTCPEPGTDPIHNFMDYSDDPCYNQFTAGQVERMHKQFLHWRVQQGYKA
jgi:hypothetical protein